jgi:Spy/CpxP family protein refolding chaperone
MKTNFKTMTVISALALALVTTGLKAQKADTTSHHRHLQHNRYGIPNLTDDQRQKIEALRTPFSKETLPLVNQLAEKRAHLRTLETADKTDPNAINGTIDDISKLQSQLMKKRAAHTQAIRNLLTDEQRVAFDLHQRAGMHHARRGGFRNHHDHEGRSGKS